MLPDTGELLKRHKKQGRQLLMQNLKSPMSLRIPLVDPDAFLTRTMPCVRLLFGWFGLLLWLAVTGAALMVVGTHWQELRSEEHTSELQSIMRNSYAVLCLKKTNNKH